jgi:hypothetical protein
VHLPKPSRVFGQAFEVFARPKFSSPQRFAGELAIFSRTASPRDWLGQVCPPEAGFLVPVVSGYPEIRSVSLCWRNLPGASAAVLALSGDDRADCQISAATSSTPAVLLKKNPQGFSKMVPFADSVPRFTLLLPDCTTLLVGSSARTGTGFIFYFTLARIVCWGSSTTLRVPRGATRWKLVSGPSAKTRPSSTCTLLPPNTP